MTQNVFVFNIPVGAIVKIGDHVLTHRGSGQFECPDLINIIEGITTDESHESESWPSIITIIAEAETKKSQHRRVALCELATSEQPQL